MIQGNPEKPDGTGKNLLIRFKLSDPDQRDAQLLCRALASTSRGRKKHFIVTLLAALYYVYSENGEMPNEVDVVNAIRGLRRD